MTRFVVIAEIASNHGGDIELAKRYIEEAKKAGADTCKFQYYDTDEIMPKDDPRYSKIKQAQLDLSQLAELREYCHGYGLEFLCTPFVNPRKAEELASIGCRVLKIRERDSKNEALIRKSLEVCDQVLISTTRHPIDVYLLYNPHIKWLLATPKYPFPIEELELSRVEIFDGISDHCRGITSSIAAAAVAKARRKESFIVEKHVTLDRSIPNLDQAVSIDFDELKELVRHLRAVERMGTCV